MKAMSSLVIVMVSIWAVQPPLVLDAMKMGINTNNMLNVYVLIVQYFYFIIK